MPFYGRPSKNCQSCRERRIKCDRLDPICSQCKRAGKTCGGYRDVPTFLFRDENDKAARLSALARSGPGSRRDPPHFSDSVSGTVSASPASTQTSHVIPSRISCVVFVPTTIPVSVPHSTEERGLRFFFKRFVTAVSGAEQGVPSILPTVPFLDTLSLEPPLQNAVVSVGLAALSNVNRDKSLLLVAREKYLSALSVVRQAAACPKQANLEQVVKIILMLSLHEMVSCTPKGIDSWTIHVDGVAALLKQVTGAPALQNSESRPHLQFYFVSIIKYFLTQGNIPPELLGWRPGLIPKATSDEQPAIDLVDILVRFIKLHYAVRHGNIVDPAVTICSLISFDNELEVWERSLPDKWTFVVEESTDLRNTFHGKYLVYNDVWASRGLNHYHWARLMINEMVLQYLTRFGSPTLLDRKRRQQSLDTISQMATNICAGAASQMGIFGRGVPTQSNSHLPPLNGVFMLLFPLEVAGSAAGAPAEVHPWVVETLERIGNTTGIQRALELIPKVKRLHGKAMQQLAAAGTRAIYSTGLDSDAVN